MGPATPFRYGGVTVAWEPEALLLRMVHGPDPQLSDHVAWTLGSQMAAWIKGHEGAVACVVDASGVPWLPDDWRDYWIKVLRRGFVKGVAVHGASPAFRRTAEDVARLTRVPFVWARDEAEARARVQGLPPLPAPAP